MEKHVYILQRKTISDARPKTSRGILYHHRQNTPLHDWNRRNREDTVYAFWRVVLRRNTAVASGVNRIIFSGEVETRVRIIPYQDYEILLDTNKVSVKPFLRVIQKKMLIMRHEIGEPGF